MPRLTGQGYFVHSLDHSCLLYVIEEEVGGFGNNLREVPYENLAIQSR